MNVNSSPMCFPKYRIGPFNIIITIGLNNKGPLIKEQRF